MGAADALRADEDVVLRRDVLLPPGIWRQVSALAQRPGGSCWVARSRGRRWVLAAPGGSDLWRMTTARSDRQVERWARQDAGKPFRRDRGRGASL